MDFLHFYNNAELETGDLLYLDSSVTSYDDDPVDLQIENLDDFSIIMSFETTGPSPKSELLTNYGTNGSGFKLGITDSNRMYLKTPYKAEFFDIPLSKKNTVALIKSKNVFSIHLIDHFSRSSDKAIFRFNNGYANNESLIFGESFQGDVDQICYIKGSIYEDVLDQLLSGFQDVDPVTDNYKVAHSGIDVRFSNFDYIYNDPLTSINRGIYEEISNQLETNYSGNYYASGLFSGSSDSNFSIEGSFNFKTGVNDNYTPGFSVDFTGPVDGSFSSDYNYEIFYRNDGIENATITFKGTYSNTSLDDPFIAYTDINEIWSKEITYSEDLSYKDDFVMEGVSIHNSDYAGKTPWTLKSYDVNKKHKNLIPKFSPADGSYKAKEDISIVNKYKNRKKSIEITSNNLLSQTSYGESVRYDNLEKTSGAALLNSNVGSESIVSDVRPRAGDVVGILNGDETFLINKIDYIETSSKDLNHSKSFIDISSLNKSISIK